MHDTNKTSTTPKARLLSLRGVRELLAAHLDPVPCRQTLTAWLNAAKVRRMKTNPSAKRGGGPVYWNAADVERMIAQRSALRGNLAPAE